MEATSLAFWCVPILVLLCSLYWYLKQTFSYWDRLGVRSSYDIFALDLILGKSITEAEIERYRKYGRLYGYYEGLIPSLLVADPELLKKILVKDFQSFTSRRDLKVGDSVQDNMVNIVNGESWKRIRNIITPAFTTGKIKKMTSVILDSTKTMHENLEKAAKSGKPANVKRLYGAFAMDVIATTAFATKVDSHNDPDNKFVTMANRTFGATISLGFILVFFFPSLFKILGMTVFDKKGCNFFKEVTLKIVEERKKTGQVRNDFLQLMMDAARDSETSPAKLEKEDPEEKNDSVFKTSTQQKGLSPDELVAQCIIFFLAGYETTSSALSFATYLLAMNSDCQERLISEIDSVLSENEGCITYEALQSMKYMDNVISETVRMFPPLMRLERVADEDYELGDTGIVIPKGMIVSIPAYAMHHDPEFYPDPEKFDPDRFSAESKTERNQYTYLPFGLGPRNCLGMRFAQMEIKICLTSVFSRFRVKVCPQTKIPVELTFGAGLLQPKDVLLDFQLRTDKI